MANGTVPAQNPVVPPAPVQEPTKVNQYAVETIVNNLPEREDYLFHRGFLCQYEFANETDYRVATLQEAILDKVKADAREAMAKWNRAIGKCQEIHAEFNRDQAIANLLKTDTGKKLERTSKVGAEVKQELS
jgi:hypothetical protein